MSCPAPTAKAFEEQFLLMAVRRLAVDSCLERRGHVLLGVPRHNRTS